MDATITRPPPPRVLILKADRLYADILRQYAAQILPTAQIAIVSTASAARDYLICNHVEIFITGLGESSEGDTLDLIAQCKKLPLQARRVLVVMMRCEYRAFAALHALPVDGVFDSAREEPGAFVAALHAVVDGARYWSASVTHQFDQMVSTPSGLFRFLTAFEQVVLSIIG